MVVQNEQDVFCCDPGSDSGLLEEYYAPGSPDCAEDLLEDEIIRDDLRSLPKSDRVYAEVGHLPLRGR